MKINIGFSMLTGLTLSDLVLLQVSREDVEAGPESTNLSSQRRATRGMSPQLSMMDHAAHVELMLSAFLRVSNMSAGAGVQTGAQ
jgi:hypothetical protein